MPWNERDYWMTSPRRRVQRCSSFSDLIFSNSVLFTCSGKASGIEVPDGLVELTTVMTSF
jgi:hypothetical protein